MKKFIKLIILLCIMPFAMQSSYAQTKKHHKKHIVKKVYKRPVYESRAAMQLQQAHQHLQEEKEVQKVQQEVKRDTAHHR